MPSLFNFRSNAKDASRGNAEAAHDAGSRESEAGEFPSERDLAERERELGDGVSGIVDRENHVATRPSNSSAFLRRADQMVVAVLWLVCAIGASWYFIDLNRTRGIIDIEKATSLEAKFMVDINSANWPELMNLPGVGEKTARDIVGFREVNGRFDSVESLTDVNGIGEATIQRLAPFIVPMDPEVSSPSTSD